MDLIRISQYLIVCNNMLLCLTEKKTGMRKTCRVLCGSYAWGFCVQTQGLMQRLMRTVFSGLMRTSCAEARFGVQCRVPPSRKCLMRGLMRVMRGSCAASLTLGSYMLMRGCCAKVLCAKAFGHPDLTRRPPRQGFRRMSYAHLRRLRHSAKMSYARLPFFMCCSVFMCFVYSFF